MATHLSEATDPTEPTVSVDPTDPAPASYDEPGLGEPDEDQAVDQDRELADRLLLATERDDGIGGGDQTSVAD